MFGSMADIQSPTAEISRGKKKKKELECGPMPNVMVALSNRCIDMAYGDFFGLSKWHPSSMLFLEIRNFIGRYG